MSQAEEPSSPAEVQQSPEDAKEEYAVVLEEEPEVAEPIKAATPPEPVKVEPEPQPAKSIQEDRSNEDEVQE